MAATDISQARQRPVVIATYMHPAPGGITAIVENMVDALADQYEVHVVAAVELPDDSRRLPLPPDRVHAVSRSKILRPTLMPTSLLFTLRVGRFLRRLVKRIDPAALILQDANFLSVPGAIATRGTDTKLAVMDHGMLTNQLDPEWQKLTRRRMPPLIRVAYRIGFALDTPWRELRWRLGLRAADAAWYVGEELEEYFARVGDRASRYAQLIPTDFHPPSEAERVAAREGLGLTGEVVVNVVGRLDGEKGLDLILDAVEAVAPGEPALRLVIAGGGTLEGWVRDQVAERGLSDRIRLTGPLARDEVRRLHHASDFHLYAGTISCGLSICLLEAMACGVVPIVSDVPAAQRDLVGEAGWVFRSGSRDELVACLREAIGLSAADREALAKLVPGRLATQPDPPLERLIGELVAA